MGRSVFNLHLNNLTPFVMAHPEPSTFARETIEESADKGAPLPKPLSGKKLPVRLDPQAKQWLEETGESFGTMAEVGRACIAMEAAQHLLETIERYKLGQANSEAVEQAVWAALGYTPTSPGTASSRADKGDP
jgi:hypothetical protein